MECQCKTTTNWLDYLPSKSRATSKASSVGVIDIQTPSDWQTRFQKLLYWVDKLGDLPVVLMAEPANEVSIKWLRAKLFPTDCPPKHHTFVSVIHIIWEWRTHRWNHLHGLLRFEISSWTDHKEFMPYLVCHIRTQNWFLPAKGQFIDNLADFSAKEFALEVCRWYAIH